MFTIRQPAIASQRATHRHLPLLTAHRHLPLAILAAGHPPNHSDWYRTSGGCSPNSMSMASSLVDCDPEGLRSKMLDLCSVSKVLSKSEGVE
eukprot:780884-Alexandrium_andersonii.AAC.1